MNRPAGDDGDDVSLARGQSVSDSLRDYGYFVVTIVTIVTFSESVEICAFANSRPEIPNT